MKMSTKRMLTAAAVFGIVGIGLAFHTGLGTPASFGWDSIALLCPLGALEVSIAERTIIPLGLVGLVFSVVAVVLLGRVFCSWLCPIPFFRRLLGGKKAAEKDCSDAKHECSSCKGCSATQEQLRRKLKTSKFDGRYAVLAAALISTAIFGFPVFCLVCPVGLSFATFIGLWHLVQYNETSLMLVIFPLILVFEIFVLRKWCHRFCPLGAVLSLIARGNRTFVPEINPQRCLRSTKGTECHACSNACPEGIVLYDPEISVSRLECTKCKECIAACPVQALSLVPFAKKPRALSVEHADSA